MENEAKKETDDLIKKAEAVAIRQEEANKVLQGLLERQEKLKVQTILSGESEAGVPQVSEEEKTKQNMKDYFKGTALEKVLK